MSNYFNDRDHARNFFSLSRYSSLRRWNVNLKCKLSRREPKNCFDLLIEIIHSKNRRLKNIERLNCEWTSASIDKNIRKFDRIFNSIAALFLLVL
jgi:hypothetical protein